MRVEAGPEERAQAGDLAGERRRGLLDLRVERDLGEAPGLAGELDVQRGHLVLGGRVDEERRGVVEELVADRALHGPVAQGLAGVEDLLDPDVLGPALAQALEVAGRVGQAVGVVDAQPVQDAVGHELEDLAVDDLEDLGVLSTRIAARSSMSKKRRYQPLSGSQSKKRARSARPTTSGSRRETPMWFGTMSSTIPRPGAARSARRPSSPPRASLTRGRVDDVVAMARPGAGLQRRGEVEMRDPEVGQVGDELPDRGEVLLGRELQPVRRAEGAHRTRRRTFSDRARDVDVRARGLSSSSPAGARVLRAERVRPHAAEPARREREGHVLVVGVEEQQEGVVLDRVAALRAVGDLLAVEEDAEGVRVAQPQSRWVIRRPSVRNHQTSGSPEPSCSCPRGRRAAEHRVGPAQGDQPPREVQQLRVALAQRPSPTRRSRCPGTRRCCCRPACGRSRRRRAASACPARASAWSGSCAAGGSAGP